MKKIIGYSIIALILAALGWGIYSRLSEDTSGRARGPKKTAVAVETADIKTAPISDFTVFTGTLKPKTTLTVTPKVSSRINKVKFYMSDRVPNGAVAAELDNQEFILDVRQAEATLEAARSSELETNASLTSATEEFERVKALLEKKIAPQSEFDAARANVDVQRARLATAKSQIALKSAALEAAKVRLSYTLVTAEWDNSSPNETMTVAERFVDDGTLIRANDPILSLVNRRVLTAVITVDERNYTRLVKDMPVAITADALPGKTFTGTISRISPLIKETSRQANVEIEILNPEEILSSGMFVRATVEYAKHENATVAPISALAKRNDLTGLFVISEMPGEGKPGSAPTATAKFVPVKIGITEGELVEILEPPISGKVVTLGQHLLEDGSAVILPGKGGVK